MCDAIEVLFWNRQGAPGFKNAEIASELFAWRVSEVNFEEVHGLSRVVRLLVDKIVTTFLLYKELPGGGDKGFLIRLVLNLLDHYQRIVDRRDPAQLKNIDDDEPALEVTLNNEVVEDCKAISLPKTVTLLRTVLDALIGQINLRTEEDYWQMAEEILRIADKVRESCSTYLEVVHPTLIESRRQGLVRVGPTLDERLSSLRNSLTEKKDLFLREYRREKERHYREG